MVLYGTFTTEIPAPDGTGIMQAKPSFEFLPRLLPLPAEGRGADLVGHVVVPDHKGLPNGIILLYYELTEPFVRKTYLICQKEALELPQVSAFVELLKKHR